MNLEICEFLDWWITEDPSTSYIFEENSPDKPITDDFKNMVLIPKTTERNTIILLLPISRYEDYVYEQSLILPLTIESLIETIYNFYSSFITHEMFQNIPISDDDMYYIDAKEKLSLKEPVQIYELLGSDRLPFPIIGNQRRHPLYCNGLIRFEGLEHCKEHTYKVLLGS